MASQDSYDRALTALRERAETALQEQHASVELSGGELATLVHELEVYRTELEMQNLDLRAAQQKIERSRNEYLELFSFAPVAYFRVDHRATIQAVNDHTVRLLGLDRGNLLGRPLTTVVAPTDHDWVLRSLDLVSDGPTSLQVGLRGAKGAYIDALLVVRTLPDTDAAGRRALLAAIDISNLRRAERALRASEERYRGLFDASRDALFLTSRVGQIIDANPAALALVCTPLHEVLRRDLVSLLTTAPPLDWPTLLTRSSERNAAPREVELTRTDGPHILELTVTPSPAEPDMSYLVALRDVTERRQADEARRSLEEERRQAQRLDSLGRLAGGIAHDMNNVLATILLLTTMLEQSATSPEMLDDLHVLAGAATRGNDLTRKLLAFARRGSAARTTICVNDVVADIAGLLRRTQSSTLRIELDVPATPVHVNANASELGQVLLNLALNAIDALGEGGVLTIRLHQEGPPSALRAVLEVRDTGSGMDSETLDRAFEPFFTTKPQGKGTGLGLSIVYGIIRELRGSVRLKSAVGGGTAVIISLPALDQPAAATHPAPAAAAAATRPLRTLVVDDESTLLDLTCRVLRGIGHTADPAQSGGEALYTLEHAETPYDLVLLDIHMPRMNGLETARRITERWPDQAIVLMSGLHDGEATASAAEGIQGVRGFLAKPFTVAGLSAAFIRAKVT